jgi:hypothetical protein
LPYVITEPESIKGVCETWDECRSKVEGVKGAKYQKVRDEAEAQALLSGPGVVLKPGLHVFTDGNDRGGVGVVIVWMSENPSDDPTVVERSPVRWGGFSTAASSCLLWVPKSRLK